MNSVSKNLKVIRTERGWTQQQMADVLFVTRQTISNWENGKAMPALDELPDIAGRLGISTEELLYGRLPEDETVKKTLKICFIVLAACFVLRFICSKLAYFDSNYFTMTGVIFYKMMVMPVFYFTASVTLCASAKACGLFRPMRGLPFHKWIAIGIVAFYGVGVLSVIPNAILEIMKILNAVELAELDTTGIQSFISSLPGWYGAIQSRFMYLNIGYPNEFSPYIWPVLGAVYEMSKPYKPGAVMFALPKYSYNGITRFDAKEKPAEYRLQCKENFKILKKDFSAACAIFAAGLLLWIFTPANNNVNIFTARPVAMFGMGLLAAVVAKVLCVILPNEGLRYRNTIRWIIMAGIAIVAFMAVPHIVRETAMFMDIKINGTYDLTGLVLTPPKWYSSLARKTVAFNSGTGVVWYAIAGFVCNLVKPFSVEEK